MKTRRTVFNLVMTILIVFGSNISFAQDTLDVPPVYEGDPLGALNRFVNANKPEAGQQRVFRLQREAIYFLSGTLVTDFDLNIVAVPAPDKANPSRPPIVASGIKTDGSTVGLYFKVTGNLHLEGIYMNLAAPNQTTGGQMIQVLKDSANVEIIGCYFENSNWQNVRIMSIGCSLKMMDCYFRNNQNPGGGVWNGRGVDFSGNNADTVIVINNTFVNHNSYAFQAQGSLIKYFVYEHNTVANTLKWPVQFNDMTNAKISNNIMYNSHSFGQTESEIISQDGENFVTGLVNTDTMTVDKTTEAGITESERIASVNNNYYFWQQKIKDYWASIDSLLPEPWMNARTAGMFADKTTWPHFEAVNNIESDIVFATFPSVAADSMVAFMKDMRDNNQIDYANTRWGAAGDTDGDLFNVQWPVPENLSYPSSDPAYTAAEGGFPVGDLNWFPNKKSEWEKWILTDVDDKDALQTIPTKFSLDQNYPNPFNPATTIAFTLAKNGLVKLSVYNILGQEVRTLLNKEMSTGKHNIVWNGKDNNGNQLSSGMYMYTLEAGNARLSKKMMLLK